MFKIKEKKFKFFLIILCIFQLFYIFYFRSGFKLEVFKDPFKESSGVIYALPSEAIELKNLLTKNAAINFNLSEKIKKDTFLYQRFIEFNYPIRYEESSKNKFFFKKENIPENCKKIEEAKYLIMTEC